LKTSDNLVTIANILAQTLYMLENKISEATKVRVLNAIETRVIKPMDLHFAGDKNILARHWWKDRQDNWNVVCWYRIFLLVNANVFNFMLKFRGGVARLAVTIITD
jgi:hypothetical protein